MVWIPKRKKSRRLNLGLNEEAHKRLEELRDLTGAASLVEVIRRSLAVYDFICRETKNGGKLFIRTDDEEKEIVLM